MWHDGYGGETKMANVQKYTRAQVGGLTRHYNRAKKDNGEYYNFGNQEIDTTRTHLNYNLAPARDQLAFIRQRTSEVECVGRANINVMCSWIVTAPKTLDDGELRLFFEEAYKFLNNRYSDGSDRNVISAYVHMDEVNPHLHYAFVPVAYDKKKEIEKVSAKIVIDRGDLQTFHKDLEQHMAAVFGREVGILNEATKEGNKEVHELKMETAQKELSALEDDIKNLQAQISSLEDVFKEKGQALINDHENKKDVLQVQIKAFEKQLRGRMLTSEQIKAIAVKTTKPTFGGEGSEKVTILLSEWESIKKTALLNADADEDIIAIKKQNKSLKKTIGELHKEIKQLEGEKEKLQVGLTEIIEMNKLKSKLQYIPKDELDRFISQFQPQKTKGRNIGVSLD